MSSTRLLAVALLAALLAPAGVHAWCVGGAPPALDPDDDGMNNLQEDFFGSSRDTPDTDGDGILDGDEDNDGDGIPNKDEPTLFSLESFVDPFGPVEAHDRNFNRKVGLVIEGTNLFALRKNVRVLLTSDQRRAIRVNRHRRYNSQVRIYLSLRESVADSLIGAVLNIQSVAGGTNPLRFAPMHCHAGRPMLMGAALVHINTRIDDRRRSLEYLAIGGCNLLEAVSPQRARTTVRLLDNDVLHTIPIDTPYGGIATLPSRLLIAAHPDVKADPVFNPVPEYVSVGDTVWVATSLGESNPVLVEPAIAELRIPPQDLNDDHDRDGLLTVDEIHLGTDPLVYDTDHDGLSDSVELSADPPTDPLDPDTDGDGTLDGPGL